MLSIRTYTENGDHHSGMIASLGSRGGLQQAFGYFEARVRFSSASGQWSAFWLQSPTLGMPLDDPEEAGVEMDVVEHRVRCTTAPPPTPPPTCGPTTTIEDRAQLGLVWNGYGAETRSSVRLTDPLAGLGNGTWHTWALNWTPGALTFLFDDREIWSQTSPISQRSQYVILSSEVWRSFAGPIPAGGYGTRETSSTNMQVDYVRAWSTPATAPRSTSPPALSGPAEVGRTLACSSGGWSGVPAPALQYRWLSDGAVIAGAAGAAYTARPDDSGRALSCRVTATSVGGSAEAQSAAIVISDPPPPPPPLPGLLTLPVPPPLTAIDRSAPRGVLTGATSQRLGTSVSVRVGCRDEPCRAAVTATVTVPRVGRARSRTFRSSAVKGIAEGVSATVRLKLSASARAAIRRALRARRRVTVRQSVRLTDFAGNERTLSRRVRLRLPGR